MGEQKRVRTVFVKKLTAEFVNPESVCYHSFWSSISCLFRKVDFKIHGILMLPVILYGSETWSLRSDEEQELRRGWLRRMGGQGI
jgi:hypothetical protein